MGLEYECLPCFMKQAVSVVNRKLGRSAKGNKVLHAAIEALHKFDEPNVVAAAQLARYLYRALSEALDDSDPFREEKHRANSALMKLLPELESYIHSSNDEFETAARLAVAGNIIDFGAIPNLDADEAVRKIIAHSKAPLAIDHLNRLREEIESAESVLYIGDNAGEIVLDKLFVNVIGPDKVTFVVRGAPVINDITLEDAYNVGLDSMCRIISTGSDVPGVDLDDASEQFVELFDSSDVVIAKGQGNFETLYKTANRSVFFLMRVKCDVISRMSGTDVGAAVVWEYGGKT